MSRHVVTISLEASFDEAKRLMLSHRIRHLPVTDQTGKLIGLFSLRAFFDEILGIKTPMTKRYLGTFTMERFSGNPILRPIEEHAWESREVFNTAAVYLDGKVHLLYRAMGNDNISRIGYANSSDGFKIDERLPQPVYEPRSECEKDGCEDPRLTEIEGQLIMTYTALREYSHLQVYQIALTSIAKEDFMQRKWNWDNTKTTISGHPQQRRGSFS